MKILKHRGNPLHIKVIHGKMRKREARRMAFGIVVGGCVVEGNGSIIEVIFEKRRWRNGCIISIDIIKYIYAIVFTAPVALKY